MMRSLLSTSEVLRRGKLEPRTLLLLLAGLVAIAYVGLGASILQQRGQQAPLSSKIEEGQAVLNTADAIGSLEELQQRLTMAEGELASAQGAFPREIDTARVIETLLAYASQSQVRLVKVNTQGPAAEPSEGNPYRAISLQLDVEGEFGQLLAFLASLDEAAESTFKVGDFLLQEAAVGHVLNVEVLTYARAGEAEVAVPEISEGQSAPAAETTGAAEGAASQ